MKLNFTKLPAPFPGMECWRANSNIGSFVIVKDYEQFTASWKKHLADKRIDIIDYDYGVLTFEEAKTACEKYANG